MSPLECQPRSGATLSLPIFHILGRMQPNGTEPPWPLSATDSNAIFEHKGIFHVMHQTPTRKPLQPALRDYHAAWGHVVSRDLVRWKRLPDALSPGPRGTYDGHDGDCDGWVL